MAEPVIKESTSTAAMIALIHEQADEIACDTATGPTLRAKALDIQRLHNAAVVKREGEPTENALRIVCVRSNEYMRAFADKLAEQLRETEYRFAEVHKLSEDDCFTRLENLDFDYLIVPKDKLGEKQLPEGVTVTCADAPRKEIVMPDIPHPPAARK